MSESMKQITKTNWRKTDDGTGFIVSGTKNASGDNTLIAAPGVGVSIVVDWFLIQNESLTATTMILKDGATAGPRFLAQYQGAILPVFVPWKLTANAALVLNLSGANQCGYTVAYHLE